MNPKVTRVEERNHAEVTIWYDNGNWQALMRWEFIALRDYFDRPPPLTPEQRAADVLMQVGWKDGHGTAVMDWYKLRNAIIATIEADRAEADRR